MYACVFCSALSGILKQNSQRPILHQKLCREMTVDAKLYVLKTCAADMIALCDLVVRRPLIKNQSNMQTSNVTGYRRRKNSRKILTNSQSHEKCSQKIRENFSNQWHS
jgi:hypothetical protein